MPLFSEAPMVNPAPYAHTFPVSSTVATTVEKSLYIYIYICICICIYYKARGRGFGVRAWGFVGLMGARGSRIRPRVWAAEGQGFSCLLREFSGFLAQCCGVCTWRRSPPKP